MSLTEARVEGAVRGRPGPAFPSRVHRPTEQLGCSRPGDARAGRRATGWGWGWLRHNGLSMAQALAGSEAVQVRWCGRRRRRGGPALPGIPGTAAAGSMQTAGWARQSRQCHGNATAFQCLPGMESDRNRRVRPRPCAPRATRQDQRTRPGRGDGGRAAQTPVRPGDGRATATARWSVAAAWRRHVCIARNAKNVTASPPPPSPGKESGAATATATASRRRPDDAVPRGRSSREPRADPR